LYTTHNIVWVIKQRRIR